MNIQAASIIHASFFLRLVCRAAAVLFFVSAYAGFCLAEPRPAERARSELKVGAILPLSGRAATLGAAIRNGITMAQDQLEPAARQRLHITFEDDRSESAGAVNAFRAMAASGVDVVLTALSNAGNAVVPFTEKNSTVHLSLAFDRAISSRKQYAFSFWPDAAAFAEAAAAELHRRGLRRIAAVTTQHEGNFAMRTALFAACGGNVEFPVNEEVLPSDSDFRTAVLRLKRERGVQAVAVLLHPGHSGLFVRVLQQQSLHLPLFALGNFEDLGMRRSAGPALRGHWYAAVDYSPDFVSAYRRRFPKDSLYGAAFGYDAVLLLSRTVDCNESAVSLAQCLRTAPRFSGASTAVTPDGLNGFRFPVTIKTVGEDGID